MWFSKILTENDMKPIREKIAAIEHKQAACDTQHLNHNRRYEDITKNQAEQTRILAQIRDTLQTYLPVLDRVKGDQTTRDKLKDYALWVAALSAGGAGIHYWAQLLTGG